MCSTHATGVRVRTSSTCSSAPSSRRCHYPAIGPDAVSPRRQRCDSSGAIWRIRYPSRLRSDEVLGTLSYWGRGESQARRHGLSVHHTGISSLSLTASIGHGARSSDVAEDARNVTSAKPGDQVVGPSEVASRLGSARSGRH